MSEQIDPTLDPTFGDAPEDGTVEQVSEDNIGAQLFFTQIIDLFNSGTTVLVVDYEKKTGEKGKIRVDLSTANVKGNRPLSDEAKKEIGELVGQATMQWSPIPSGTFKSEEAGKIVEKIIEVAENA